MGHTLDKVIALFFIIVYLQNTFLKHNMETLRILSSYDARRKSSRFQLFAPYHYFKLLQLALRFPLQYLFFMSASYELTLLKHKSFVSFSNSAKIMLASGLKSFLEDYAIIISYFIALFHHLFLYFYSGTGYHCHYS